MTTLCALDDADLDALADRYLRCDLASAELGPALFVAAALQVYLVREAASLDVRLLRLLERRGLCPVCGCAPVSSVVTASGRAPGTRYLHCSLCSTAWNYVRAVCVTCGGSRSLSLQEIEGRNGAVKAETCDQCRRYIKVLYETRIREWSGSPMISRLSVLTFLSEMAVGPATSRPNLSSPDESAAPPGQSCATAAGSVDRD
jgi:FdhE protein